MTTISRLTKRVVACALIVMVVARSGHPARAADPGSIAIGSCSPPYTATENSPNNRSSGTAREVSFRFGDAPTVVARGTLELGAGR